MTEIIRKKYTQITNQDRKSVINLFTTKNENSIPVISKELNITESAVNRIINDYLEAKRLGVHSETKKVYKIRTNSGSEHLAYTKEIDGKIYFVCSNHTTKFLAKSVTIINEKL